MTREPSSNGDDAVWVSLDEAGQLIDGLRGWSYDENSGARPQARSLFNLASSGKVRMKAKEWNFFVNDNQRSPSEEEKSFFAGVLLSREIQGKNKLNPIEFGGQKTQDIFREANEKLGQFDFYRMLHNPDKGEFRVYRHLVFGLRFNRRDIEEWFDLRPDTSLKEGAVIKAPRGRKPAQWWPDFAEELAVYIHETGIPAGEGAEGQSAVIAEVFDRLAKRGCTEPNRTSVQPVVRNLLKRLRSAEK